MNRKQKIYMKLHHNNIIDDTLNDIIDEISEEYGEKIIHSSYCSECSNVLNNSKKSCDECLMFKNEERNDKMKTYVLKLTDDKYYIGKTTNINTRFFEHISDRGSGSKWTRLYKPISIIATFDFECEKLLTLFFMKMYGIDNVRGSYWCRIQMKDETKKSLLKQIKDNEDNFQSLKIPNKYIDNELYLSKTIFI